MPEAVLVCDPDDRIRIVNLAAERLFKGRPVRDRSDLLGRFERLRIDPQPDKPVTLRPRDVPNRWFELRSVPVSRGARPSDSEATGRIFILRDVTEARLARAERRRSCRSCRTSCGHRSRRSMPAVGFSQGAGRSARPERRSPPTSARRRPTSTTSSKTSWC